MDHQKSNTPTIGSRLPRDLSNQVSGEPKHYYNHRECIGGMDPSNKDHQDYVVIDIKVRSNIVAIFHHDPSLLAPKTCPFMIMRHEFFYLELIGKF